LLASVGYCGRVHPTVLHTRLTDAPRGHTGPATTAYIVVLGALTGQIAELAASITE
jgi:hypothetical protein